MSRLLVSEFVTVDGVMEDPGGVEGFEHGGWAFQFERGAEGDRFKLDETLQAGSLLLGRVTYEGFAAAWPSRKDEAGFAEKMNAMPKHVVSSTLERAEWNNSRVLGSDLAAVSELKREAGGDILVAGSCRLVNGLAQQGLIDEYRLMVFPIILGSGKRLFTDTGKASALRLTSSKAAGECMILTYEPRAAAAG
jgi:dihydrofolate reductase